MDLLIAGHSPASRGIWPMEQLAVNGVEIAYLDEGSGPVIVIGHCSSASHKEWLPLIETLRSDWRVLAPDFVGYGKSDPWPPSEPFRDDTDLSVLLALTEQTEGALHLVGHSYGGALALEAARTLGSRIKSLALIEPVSFHLLRQQGRPEWAEIEKLGKAVLGAVAKGDDRAAAAAFMSYWLGRFRWFISPERFKSAISATIPKVALEFGILVEAPTTLQDYAAITAPTLLVKGSKTPAPTRAVIDLLGRTLPNARVETLRGAGHMSPFTHPSEINRLIINHLATQR
jgi:pimeloyl-ACP methyl ester carboxylesterase